jgi:hypothetical protein
MIEDKELVKMSYEMDNILVATGNKYGIGALSLAAIVLARLMKLNEETGNLEDFKKLLIDASKTESPDSFTIQ